MESHDELADVHEHLSEAIVKLAGITGRSAKRPTRLMTVARLLTQAQSELADLGRELREARATENLGAARD